MIYLDNSATTKQHPRVTEKMLRYMEEDFGNPSSLHSMGLTAEKAIKEARRRISSTVGISGGSITFTSGGTESDNMALFGAAKAMKRRGNRIVTTMVEHPAVLECMKKLEEEGFEVIRLGVDRQGMPDRSELESAIDDKTILVSMMQVNNEVGTVMPVDEAAIIIKKKDSPAVIHSDAVQGFGKLPLPASADMISISGHKIHGPKGSGALWIRDGLKLQPYLFGGGQEAGMRSGTENVPAIAGLGEAAELMEDCREENFRKVSGLRKHMIDAILSQVDDVVINGPDKMGSNAGDVSPYILSMSFLNTRGEVLLHTLEQDGIFLSTGSACSSNKKGSSHVLKAMGLTEKESEGTVRFSFSADNRIEEIEEAAERTADAVKRFRRLGSFR